MKTKRGGTAAPPSRISSVLFSRLLRGAALLARGMLAVLAEVVLFLSCRIYTNYDSVENVTPAPYLLANYKHLSFNDARRAKHAGWLLVELKGTPVIIRCPG